MSDSDCLNNINEVQDIPFPDIPGLEFRLFPEVRGWCVSDTGRVFSRKAPGGLHARDRLVNQWTELKKQNNKKTGYFYLTSKLNGKIKNFKICRIVLISFSGPPPTLRHVCRHMDANRKNDNISNLKWGTKEEDLQDSLRNNTFNSGEKNHKSKLSREMVLRARELRSTNVPYERITDKIIEEFKVNISMNGLYEAVTGTSWTHLDKSSILKKFFRQFDNPEDALNEYLQASKEYFENRYKA